MGVAPAVEMKPDVPGTNFANPNNRIHNNTNNRFNNNNTNNTYWNDTIACSGETYWRETIRSSTARNKTYRRYTIRSSTAPQQKPTEKPIDEKGKELPTKLKKKKKKKIKILILDDDDKIPDSLMHAKKTWHSNTWARRFTNSSVGKQILLNPSIHLNQNNV